MTTEVPEASRLPNTGFVLNDFEPQILFGHRWAYHCALSEGLAQLCLGFLLWEWKCHGVRKLCKSEVTVANVRIWPLPSENLCKQIWGQNLALNFSDSTTSPRWQKEKKKFLQVYFVLVKFFKWAKSQSGQFALVSGRKKKRQYKVQVHLEILTYAQKWLIYLPKFFCVILYIRSNS